MSISRDAAKQLGGTLEATPDEGGDFTATFKSIVVDGSKVTMAYDSPDDGGVVTLDATLDGATLKGTWKSVDGSVARLHEREAVRRRADSDASRPGRLRHRLGSRRRFCREGADRSGRNGRAARSRRRSAASPVCRPSLAVSIRPPGIFDERQLPFYPDDIGRHITFEGADRVGSIAFASWAGAAFTGTPSRCVSRKTISARAATGSSPIGRSRMRNRAVLQPCRTDHWRLRHSRGPAQIPDGEFYGPPPNMRCASAWPKVGTLAGIPVIPVRKAMLVGQSREGRMHATIAVIACRGVRSARSSPAPTR